MRVEVEKPRADLTLPVNDRDHIQGNIRAPVTLLEYGDFECPYCLRAYSVIKGVQADFGQRLKFVFRNFPLSSVHPHAEFAAEAAESAGAQNKFWEMHDYLYDNQSDLGRGLYLESARALQLDEKKFLSDLSERRFKERVKEDFMSGVKSGVNGTPGFFINGMRYQGSWDTASLTDALNFVFDQAGL